MSGSRANSSEENDLQLNLSPPIRDSPLVQSPNTSSVSSSMEIMSPESSCLSSEVSSHTEYYSPGSPEAIISPMMLVGCPRCLMYVMLSDVDPKCPQCKSTVLLDFLNDELTKRTIN